MSPRRRTLLARTASLLALAAFTATASRAGSYDDYFLGIELDRPCGELVKAGLDAGLVFNVTSDNVIRLLPALVMSETEGREVVERLVPLVKAFLAQGAVEQKTAAAR